MFAKCVLGLLLAASAHWPMAANAQSAPSNGISDKGLIIRVMDRLLFIDMGRQEGVQAGDFLTLSILKSLLIHSAAIRYRSRRGVSAHYGCARCIPRWLA